VVGIYILVDTETDVPMPAASRSTSAAAPG
jgi:hypothetical protein